MKVFDSLNSVILKRCLLLKFNRSVDSFVDLASDIAPEAYSTLGSIVEIHVNELDSVDFEKLAMGISLIADSFSEYDHKKTRRESEACLEKFSEKDGRAFKYEKACSDQMDSLFRSVIVAVKQFTDASIAAGREEYKQECDNSPDYSHLFIETDHIQPVVFFLDDVEICRLNVKILICNAETLEALADSYPVFGDAIEGVDIVDAITDVHSYFCLFTEKNV